MIHFTNLVSLEVFESLQIALAVELLGKLAQLICDLIDNGSLCAALFNILHVDLLVKLLLHVQLVCFHVDRLECVICGTLDLR